MSATPLSRPRRRAALRRVLVVLLALASVFALSAGTAASGPAGTEVRPADVRAGAFGAAEVPGLTGLVGAGGVPGEGEVAPDGSVDTGLRFQAGSVRRCPAVVSCPRHHAPAVLIGARPAHVPHVTASARTAPARGPGPYTARCAVLRC
jgi:hypothetical protein